MGESTEDRVKDLFLEALGKEQADRVAWLDDTCPDPALRREVAALLRAHEKAEGFLEHPQATAGGPDERPGTVIDRYKLLQEIGEGGFGVVYMAEQTEPVQRKVALKILKLGMDTRQVVARFEAERQALALMDHPNIAKVLDGGATPNGRPYFVMELVKGVSVTEYCDQAGLSTAERLEIFQDVCHAVQHAHQKGVIHRDIKPRNVLVTLHDGRPVPKVIDFGIAKALDRVLTQKTMFTEFQQIIGTPEYMAPEQAEMTSLDVDTRADIYSLGVLLYELLTGTQPFDMKSLLAQGYGEILRTIREVEPPRPSTRLSTLGDLLPTIAKQRHTEPKLLGKTIRGDLDWIVMKALEKDRGRRYDTATALADDIARYLTDQPVLASPPSRAYRVRKYLRRNKAAVAAAGAVLLALVGGLSVALWGWRDAAHQAEVAAAAESEAAAQRDQARDEATKASQILAVLNEMLASASPYEEPDRDYTVRQMLLDFEQGLDARLAGRPRVEAAIRVTMARALEDLLLLDEAERNLRRALDLLELDTAGQEAQIAEAMTLDGLIQMGRGRHADAERALRRALELYEGPAAHDVSNHAAALTVLGSALEDQGRYAEAEAAHREAETIARAMSSDPQHILPTILNNLSNALTPQWKYAEAERKLREALDLHGTVYGRDHPQSNICLNNLAAVLHLLGREDEAFEMGMEVLQQRRRQFSEGHPLIASVLNNLGNIQTTRRQFDAAEKLLQEAYAIHEAHGGEEHPRTVTTLNNLGILAFERGRFVDAEKRFQAALRLRRKILRAGHPLIAKTMMSLGAALARLAKTEAAESMLLDAEGATRRSFGSRHPQVGEVLEQLATLYRRAGRFAEAERRGREALELREAALGGDHPKVAQALIDLGHVLQALGRFEEAARLLERAKDIARRRRGKDHPNVAVALDNLALVLRQTEHPERALPVLAEAHRILVEAFGPESRRALRVGVTLAHLHSDLGDHAVGERMMREFLRSKQMPARLRPSALAAFGQILLRVGKFDEAEPVLRESLALRHKTAPGSWLIWNSASLYGESLMGLRRFDAAEAQLVGAFEKMDPPDSSMGRLRKREALERVVHLYEAWEKPVEAAAWKAKLEALAPGD